ncbi:MAG: hypothetical protein WBO55_01690 [Rhizobiaceae bacterium]
MGRLEYIAKDGVWVTPDLDQATRPRFGTGLSFSIADGSRRASQLKARLDRGLTWMAYYVLVYVSACVFLPVEAAHAFDRVGEIASDTMGWPPRDGPQFLTSVPLTLAPREALDQSWELRGSSD